MLMFSEIWTKKDFQSDVDIFGHMGKKRGFKNVPRMWARKDVSK